MRVMLFDNQKLIKLNLPEEIDGSFWLKNGNDVEDDNLASISSSDNSWVMKPNPGIKMQVNGEEVSETKLQAGMFYYLIDKSKIYALYIEPLYDETYKVITMPENCNYVIGNTQNDNIIYNIGLINNQKIGINFINGEFRMAISKGTFVFNNNVLINSEQTTIHNGDVVFFYGLRITFANNLMIINNPFNRVKLNGLEKNLMEINYQKYDKVVDNSELRMNLYNEEDYFYKTPRLRRYIKTYDLSVANPPEKKEEEDTPFILVVGPMLTMGMVSGVTFGNTIFRVSTEQASMAQSWPSLVMAGAMLISMLVWPTLTRRYQKKKIRKYEKNRQEKYGQYIEEKRKELYEVTVEQTNILNEQLLTALDCVNIIEKQSVMLWNRQNFQDDFLSVRIGMGDFPLNINVSFQEDEFSLQEDELLQKAKEMVHESSLLKNVPIEYSFKDNLVTAVQGPETKVYPFMKNILFQLATFHSFDELKIVLMLDDSKAYYWQDFKNLPHIFSDDKSVRFFATNFDEMLVIDEYLQKEFIKRNNSDQNNEYYESEKGKTYYKPHYLIITDDYQKVRKLPSVEMILESSSTTGFGFIILENKLGKLPSQCLDFINIGTVISQTLKNSANEYITHDFKEEIFNEIDYAKYIEKLSNIPLKTEDENALIPNSISFLEMYQFGRIEQFNSQTRWRQNDPTQSLKALVGITEGNNKVYLDLHEKYHGPHGLIAGTTGSGKSEFIITYILSMALNYSPEEVAFILIDYKGGGLAGAFDNKALNIKLPHLAGVITNLDKSELNRTLISINSELTRRQLLFNAARDKLGESTIDIYKYQQFYREGKLDEPMPHLFIISDEFAELKSQQPEFMDDLVSAARIGRSLGVHLILATQKPSGVVNDQIWSNSKFKVCLKVQDRADSNEMLKKPDAAEITNAGRFYLQVGYDEYYVLAQSGYAGVMYHPSDFLIEEDNDNMIFIDNVGKVIKEVELPKEVVEVNSKGDQLSNVLQYIYTLATKQKLFANQLWLPMIPQNIYISNLINKYKPNNNTLYAILGEYDDPASQSQGLLTLQLDDDANTLIYGRDPADREMFINSIVYSLCTRYVTEAINIYLLDFGSETMRMFLNFPQVGDVVFASDTEKINKTFSVINDLIVERKQLFADYNGDYFTYIKNSGKTLPMVLFIINNYENFLENYNNFDEDIIRYAREGKRYGIIIMLSASSPRTIFSKLARNFENAFALELSDQSDYYELFGKMGNLVPAEVKGRGICKINNKPCEFQTAQITNTDLLPFIKQVAESVKKTCKTVANPIPVLPDRVLISDVVNELKGLNSVPIGIFRQNLKVDVYDFTRNKSTIITAQETDYVVPFVRSLIKMFNSIKNTNIILLDFNKLMKNSIENVTGYLDKGLNNSVQDIMNFIDKNIVSDQTKQLIFIFVGMEKLLIPDNTKALDALVNKLKTIDNANIIFADSAFVLKKLSSTIWYSDVVRNDSGIYIGSGMLEQSVIRLASNNKLYNANLTDKFAWHIDKGKGELIKIVEEANEE